MKKFLKNKKRKIIIFRAITYVCENGRMLRSKIVS